MTYPIIPVGQVGPDIALDGYSEQGIVELFQASYAVPLDGRPRTMVLTDNITITTGTKPTAPVTGSVRLSLIQDATGGRTIGWDGTWEWPDGTPATPPTGSNEGITLILTQTPDDRIEACAQTMA